MGCGLQCPMKHSTVHLILAHVAQNGAPTVSVTAVPRWAEDLGTIGFGISISLGLPS